MRVLRSFCVGMIVLPSLAAFGFGVGLTLCWLGDHLGPILGVSGEAGAVLLCGLLLALAGGALGVAFPWSAR